MKGAASDYEISGEIFVGLQDLTRDEGRKAESDKETEIRDVFSLRVFSSPDFSSSSRIIVHVTTLLNLK